MFRQTILLISLLFPAFVSKSVMAEPPPGTVPLYGWYSPSRGDNFTTTTWTGEAGDIRSPDYRWFTVMGYVIPASVPGTIPLYHWYNPDRGDNLTTSDPSWAGRAGDVRAGYQCNGIMAYVKRGAAAGSVPLYSWYSPSRQDNFLTTEWAGGPGDIRSPDYRFVRVEGYVLPVTANLYSWYSRNRGDNFATTRWTGTSGDTRSPGYRFSDVIGTVLTVPGVDTIPLYHWYNPDRGDNFTTTDPSWAGTAGETRGGYRFVEVLGHVLRNPIDGTTPLYAWYSPGREDNFVSAAWTGGPGDLRSPDYRFVRVEGYVFPPVATQRVLRVSVKWILDSSSRRPATGFFRTDAQIQAAIGDANTVLANNGASWRLSLAEIVDVAGASQYFEMTEAEQYQLEQAALSDPARYAWRSDAINFYVVNNLIGAGGRCSFPVHYGPPQTFEIIAINNSGGILNGGVGWLHEIGHYLSLLHTFEDFSDSPDTRLCAGQGAVHASGNVRCPDVCPHENNVMSYNSISPRTSATFSPCQLTEMEREITGSGSRGHVTDVALAGSATAAPLAADMGTPFRRGDTNGDGKMDISDAVLTLKSLFVTGDEFPCDDAADVNDNGAIDLSDAIGTLSTLFTADNYVAVPGPDFCSPDPTPEDGLWKCQYDSSNCPEGELPAH